MRTGARVEKALHSVLSTQHSALSSVSFRDSRRQTPSFPSIRVCWLLIPCALGLLSCSTGRSPTATAAKPATGTHHFVRPGETLAAIGRLYGVNWQTLAQVNQLVDPHRIEVGQAVWIPSRSGVGGGGPP